MLQIHPNDELIKHFRLTKSQKRALEKLSLKTVLDLLRHLPSRYEDIAGAKKIKELAPSEMVTIYGQLRNLEKKLNWKTKKYVVEADLVDDTGFVRIRWFNQSYVAEMFKHAKFVKIVGKTSGKNKLYFANPMVEIMPSLPKATTKTTTNAFIAVYPESKGITSKWFGTAVKKIISKGALNQLSDPLPKEMLEKYNLPSLGTAFVWAHTPKTQKDARAARKRFAFEEVFAIQLAKQKDRLLLTRNCAPRVQVNEKVKEFIKSFPYTLTNAQRKAINDILLDFKRGAPMSRLLEGDVGSGKTAVATAGVYAVATSRPPGRKSGNLQTAYMVPTEILARQQFESFIEFFKKLPVNIGLITSSGCMKYPSKVDTSKPAKISRAQLLKWVKNGEIPILIGTHSLIQRSVKFANLAFVIIDEQHRFGTLQRKTLARKGDTVPHLLSMTATPIPRTLALTIYGDLDLTILGEMPKGRKPVHTVVAKTNEREGVYEKVREELKKGRQAYVICPRVFEPDPNKALALRVKSAVKETEKLQENIFPEYNVSTLHGKMTPKEKEEVMQKFEDGKINVLVATSVVEVGVNVPNATVMIIEGAERFGLAQLHQLRGRVQRSEHRPYCYLFTESKNKQSITRLKVLEKSSDGFMLAEEDLKLRGSGELYGVRQWGISDLGMEAIKNIKMVEAARKEAQKLVEEDPELAKYPKIKALLNNKVQNLHFE